MLLSTSWPSLVELEHIVVDSRQVLSLNVVWWHHIGLAIIDDEFEFMAEFNFNFREIYRDVICEILAGYVNPPRTLFHSTTEFSTDRHLSDWAEV